MQPCLGSVIVGSEGLQMHENWGLDGLKIMKNHGLEGLGAALGDKTGYIFWTCSGHVPKQFGGSNMKFFQKVLGTFGLCFGIIPGV